MNDIARVMATLQQPKRGKCFIKKLEAMILNFNF